MSGAAGLGVVFLEAAGGEACAVRGAVCRIAVVCDGEVEGQVGEGFVDLKGGGRFEG